MKQTTTWSDKQLDKLILFLEDTKYREISVN